jgi:iron complex outermembrane receptor protein
VLGGQARADEAAASGELAEVVVTAQRFEQNLQRTPVSVARLSQDDLTLRGVADPAALQGLLPGVQVLPIGDVLVNIRGIGTFNLQPGADAAVAYNVDDVYIAHGTGLAPVLFDVDHLEALRGPQGTLYGRNTNAGAINLFTRRPVLGQWDAAGSLQAGSYGLLASEGMVNAPLGDTAALRASFATQKHDGYIDDGHNDAKIFAGRLRLLVDPSENLSLLLTAEYSHQGGVGWGGSSPCPANFATAGCNQGSWQAYAGNETPTPNDYRTVKNAATYAQVTYNFSEAVLTSITSWRRVEFANLTTTGDARIFFGDFGYNPSNTDSLITQELRLNSVAHSRYSWVVGAYLSRERLKNEIDRYFLGNTLLGVSETVSSYRSNSRAVFAQATFPVADSLRLTGGLRFTDEDKNAVGAATSFFTVPATTVPTGGSESHSGLTWKAGIEYDVTQASMLYGNVSTGFKSGGVNQSPPGFGIPASYQPERITAYQLGSKNRFFGNRFQVNAELFRYNYKGFQDLLSSVAPGYLAFYTANSQTARVEGGEFETQTAISSHDRFDASLALLNARLTTYDLTAFGGPNYSGNRMRNTPRTTINAGYEHEFGLGAGGGLRARVDAQWASSQFTESSNAIGGKQDSYAQMSASLQYEPASGHWSVTAWGRNLGDETVMYSYFGGRGYPQAPRTFGITFKAGLR